MASHPDHAELDRFRARTLAPAALLRVDRHLHGCTACLEAVRPAPQAAERIARRVVANGWHPDYVELEAWVDGHADATLRARMRWHLRWCRRCADELADLEQAASALRQPVTASSGPSGWRGWLAGPWRAWPALAGAALSVMVAAGVLVQARWHAGEPGATALPAAMEPRDGGTAPIFDNGALEQLDQVSSMAQAAYRRSDYATLAALLQAPADAGQPVAAEALGLLFARGLGVPQDADAAARYWRAAERAGSASAARNLALLSPR